MDSEVLDSDFRGSVLFGITGDRMPVLEIKQKHKKYPK